MAMYGTYLCITYTAMTLQTTHLFITIWLWWCTFSNKEKQYILLCDMKGFYMQKHTNMHM